MHDATWPAIGFFLSLSEARAIEPSGSYLSQYQSARFGALPLVRYMTVMSFNFLSLSQFSVTRMLPYGSVSGLSVAVLLANV